MALILNAVKTTIFALPKWRVVRVVEGARLESVYTSKGYRGFESLTLRKENLLSFVQEIFLFLSVENLRFRERKNKKISACD